MFTLKWTEVTTLPFKNSILLKCPRGHSSRRLASPIHCFSFRRLEQLCSHSPHSTSALLRDMLLCGSALSSSFTSGSKTPSSPRAAPSLPSNLKLGPSFSDFKLLPSSFWLPTPTKPVLKNLVQSLAYIDIWFVAVNIVLSSTALWRIACAKASHSTALPSGYGMLPTLLPLI